jgi:signal transduction histidine kinase
VKTLSGRFFLLTIVFVMLGELLVFVPSLARFRMDALQNRLERAQIASLALLADDMITPALEEELLANAEVFNVVLLRDTSRQLVLSRTVPGPVNATYDLRQTNDWQLIRDALATLLNTENTVIRLIGAPVKEGGDLIEIAMPAAPLRAAMVDYSLNILLLSLIISAVAAVLLLLVVQLALVRPIRSVVTKMVAYADAPQDPQHSIVPRSSIKELRQAEEAMTTVQTQLTGALRQKDHLAQLGEAVAKISHDLRNILTTAQLFSDRIEYSADPGVQRAAPKLLAAIRRAVTLCDETLSYGRAEEAPPKMEQVYLHDLVDDVFEGEALAAQAEGVITYENKVDKGLVIQCDPEQMHRVISNLARNSRQAIVATGKAGIITAEASDHPTFWRIDLVDTGPGLPKKAQQNLFRPFQGGARKGGTGLGLAIARELITGHSGELTLGESNADGTRFQITLPKKVNPPSNT